MKSYTDLSQSKTLSKILPHETADMWFVNGIIVARDSVNEPDDIKSVFPYWSLAALLNYLKSKNKFPEIKELSDGRFKLATYIWDGEDCIQVSIGDTIVDACYEMVLKLHELNLL